MRQRPLQQLCGLLATAAIALVLIGCNGKAGQSGTNGTNGTNGTSGTNGTPGAVTLNVAGLTPTEWGALTLKGSVQSVAVSATSSQPVVNFTVTDGNGMPVSGLAALTTKATKSAVIANANGSPSASATYAIYTSYANVSMTIAKLVPGANGSPNYWVNYIVNSVPALKVSDGSTIVSTPGKPSTDNIGSLVDHGDGTYTYTFSDIRDINKMQGFLDGYGSYTATNVKADLTGDPILNPAGVTFQPTLTHRVAIQIGGNARGTSTNTPDGSNTGIAGVPIRNAANLIYDFVPSRPAATQAVTASDTQRQIVDIDACNRCHSKLAPHGGGRVDTQYCVTCHTDQRKYGNAEATTTATGYSGSTSKINGLAAGNFVAFIHRMHMGEELQKTGYNYGGILFNDVTYPQHIGNCKMCHTGTATAPTVQPQGDNWMNVPSRLACGACHDNVNFATGANHGPAGFQGAIQLDDKSCAGCHNENPGFISIVVSHAPAAAPDPTNGGLTVAQGGVASNTHTNASYVAADLNNLPAGAHWFKWNIKSVSVNASRQPVWVFNFWQDGTTTVAFNTYSAGVKTELLDGYVGGPNLYMAFSVPQDGIAKPADWNSSVSVNLRKLWRGGAAAGSAFTGPDASGYYTATLAGVTVPANATMITGGIGYFYGVVAAGVTGDGATDALQLTQTNLVKYPFNVATVGGVSGVAAPYQGGLCVPNPNQYMAAGSTSANVSPRRAIVSTAKCNECHLNLGVFTGAVFHDGQRNDAPTCTFCHNVNGVNSGWGYNIKEAVHSLHSGSKRATPFTWQSSHTYWNVTYPAILNNCEACHVAGSYDFSASASANAVPNLLWTTIATGTMSATGIALTDPTQYDATKTYIAPFVTAGVVYGQGLQVNTTAAAKPATTWLGVTIPLAAGSTLEPEPTTLVNSPIASACYACHDSAIARAHMVGNGAALNVPRSSVTTAVAGVTTVPIVSNEQCLICHGNGKTADIRQVHMTWK